MLIFIYTIYEFICTKNLEVLRYFRQNCDHAQLPLSFIFTGSGLMKML